MPGSRPWPKVSQALDFASAKFRDGQVPGFKNTATYAGADLACIFEVESWRARVAGGEDISPFDLRVASTFRREEDGWKLVHRHADPITTFDPRGPLRGS